MPSDLKILQTNSFNNGMNSDIADELMPNDSYRFAQNIHVLSTGDGESGIVTNPKGTLRIYHTLPEGRNICIGRREDTERNKFYWFNWNSNGFHGIYMYDALLKSVTPVLINLTDTADVDILEFTERGLILHIDVVLSPKGDSLLYFAQGDFKAKKINVQKALDKSSTGYGSVILPEYINAYKLESIFPPSLAFFTDTTRESNYLYTYLFKASVRHIYDDGELNNWSEFSVVPLPLNEGFGGNTTVSNVNNGLRITVETGSSIVTQIEIAISISSEPFVSIIVLDKKRLGIANDTTYDYLFYNDNASYSGLDQLTVYRAYSFLPFKPATQSFTKNSMIYGKGLEGFEPVDVDISSDVIYSDLFIDDSVEDELNDPSFIAQLLDHDFTREGKGRRRNGLVKITVGNDVKAGNPFELFGRNGQSDNLSFSYTATNADSALTVADNFKQQLVATGRIRSTSQDLPDTDIWTNSIDGLGNVSFQFIWYGLFNQNVTNWEGRVTPVSTATLKNGGQSILTHKSGGTVKYGIIYYDEDTRRSNTFTEDSAVVRTKFVTQTEGFKKVVHQLTIKSLPPIWAKYYEIVRTQDLTYGNDYVQILIQKAIESQSTTTVDYVDLVIGSLYTYQAMYPNTVVTYEFEKNDRVRLIKKEDGDTFYPFLETIVIDFKPVGTTETINEDVTTNNTSTVTIGGVTTSDNIGRYIVIDNIEREIIAVPSGTTYTLDRPYGTAEKYPSFQIVDKRGILRVRKPINVTIEDNSVVEVYKPTQNVESAQKNFYLFGQKYAISDWGTEDRAHTGNIQNQSPSNPVTTPAVIDIAKGTSYVRNRELPTNNQILGTQVVIDLVEDKGYSDFYVSDMNDNGKIAPEDDGAGQIRFGSRLRYSNNYIEGTRINGLNDFDNTDREDYNDPFGDIMRTVYREGLLYVFKFLKNCYTPILANVIVDEQGQEILGTSDKVLNKLQYFAWEGGCGNNPESYASDQTWQYILSPNSGVDCKIGGNGVLPISEQFGLDTDIKRFINNATNNSAFVFGGFDRLYGERILAFERFNRYLYNAGFSDARFQTYLPDLPEGTLYEITTQPVNGEVAVDGDGNFVYTPDTDFVGSDPFFYRWKIPGGDWTSPKKECITVTPLIIPLVPNIFYNDALSENFTKDDCAPGYHGSIVPYEVPEFRYSSPISQEDADLQAQNEATSLGQQYANQNGTCALNPPNPFSFTDLTGLEPSTPTTSNSQTITGAYSSYPISVSAGEYRINGGDWTSDNGVVPNGGIVEIRRTTSSSYNTAVSTTVNIGGVTDSWSITTRTANNIVVNWTVDYGIDPTTQNGLIFFKSGSEVARMNEGTGTLTTGTFKEGDVFRVNQVAYAAFRWAPTSNANLKVDRNGAEVFNGNVTDQTPVDLQNYGDIVIPNGTTVIDVFGTGSSDAVGYITETLQVNNYLATDEFEITLTDNVEVDLGLNELETPNGTSYYPFNVKGTSGDLTVYLVNNKATAIDYSIAGEGGYVVSGTIPGLGNVTHSDVPKGGVVVEASDSTGGAVCGVPVPYSGGQTYPTIQVITLGTGLGTVTLNFDAVSVPDKFIVMFDGVEVINTGYRGNTAHQAALDAALAVYGAPPETITSPGSGTANFSKGTATTTATVYVYAPMAGTAWTVTLDCPV